MDIELVRHALRAYGYVDEGVRWFSRRKHNTTQSWEETEGGFLRWDPDNGAWQATPYALMPDFQKTGGLDFRNPAHQHCFEWVWPAEHVEKIYREGWEAQKAHAEAFEAEKAARVAAASPVVAELPAPVAPPPAPVLPAEPEPVPERERSFIDKLLGL